jgi:hypothetical protein
MQELDKSISFDGRDIRLKVGLLAPQAGGSLLIESGETSVLVTATRSTAEKGLIFYLYSLITKKDCTPLVGFQGAICAEKADPLNGRRWLAV